MIEFDPFVRLEIVNVAWPVLSRLTGAWATPSITNCTGPCGTPAPLDEVVAAAVKVTDWPKTDPPGCDELSVTTTGAWLTCCTNSVGVLVN